MPKRRSPKARKSRSAPIGVALDLRALQDLLSMFKNQSGRSDLEAAQDLMWDAWDTSDRRRRIEMTKEALRISPLCADAYVLLARETAPTLDEQIDLYRQGIEAGEKALGKRAFRDDVGHFWGILETRPYMRARQGLAQALWDNGLREEAVAHYQDMLRLNPNDNQGIRYLLIDCLLTLGRDQDARQLLKRYKDDGAANWAWSRALSQFRTEGDGASSRRALASAVATNKHVPAYLLGRKKLPRRLPEYVGIGDVNEAVAYVHGGAAAWAAAAGAVEWLATCLPNRSAAAPRN
jgi:tetratricopeptide (TPR) repeat protein